MTKSPAIIDLAEWLRTPAGRYLLAWEQQHLDHAVVDLFGFHAVQLGLPELDATAPGFIVRLHQANKASGELPNSTQRAEDQLAGFLIDPLTPPPRAFSLWAITV